MRHDVTSLILGLALLDPAQAAVSGWITASSTLTDDDNQRHAAERAVARLLGAGWGEGESGYGTGSWLDIDLGRATDFQTVSIWPGNLAQGKKSFREYSRPRVVKITISGGAGGSVTAEATLEDKMQRVDIPIQGNARKIRIDVEDVYEGFVFSDLFIAEVAVNFEDCFDRISPMITWLGGADAQAQAQAHEAAVRAAYNTIRGADFGDEGSLDFLMDMAGDGAAYARSQVQYQVDVGFRAAAVPPDPVAMKALRKLKDPNAIPALELARLRSTGAVANELEQLVEVFYAYQELIGGPSFNVPPWGQEGWSPGELRSFGEPLPLEVDREGRVLVADIGNNRIQRYGASGTFDRQWGPEADISDVWMGGGRPYYVSGARPGDEAGRFKNPVDVTMIPGKDSDGFAVLDAFGRVEIFDGSGARAGGFALSEPGELDDGLGGQGYLVYVEKKKALCVVFNSQLYTYTLDGELLGEWKLADGIPGAVEDSGAGKLLMSFGPYVLLYGTDGFRHGTLFGPEVLGQGFEALDMTLDEKGKLWIVTEQGDVFKFKRPGKVDYRVSASEISLIYPRLAVQADRVWISDRDRIITLDAMQQKMDNAAVESSGVQDGELDF